MKFFTRSYDGGPNSGVTGYWLIEWKKVFSIVVLKFNKGSREAFHSHAFNAITIWIKGNVTEQILGSAKERKWKAFDIKYTPKKLFHRIVSDETSWAISFRGPWENTWQESIKGKTRTLSHGRVVIDNNKDNK